MYRTPITTTHDADGLPHVILSMDQAQEILYALETAVAVAPVEGGTPLVVAAASPADFYRWAGLFAGALGTITAGIARCLEMPDTEPRTTAHAEAPVGDATAPTDDEGSIRGMTGVLQWLSQVLSAQGVDVQEALQAAATPAT